MNIKNKLLISFILFLVLTFSIISSCYAVDYFTISDVKRVESDDLITFNINYSIYQEYPYIVIFDNPKYGDPNDFELVLSNQPLIWNFCGNYSGGYKGYKPDLSVDDVVAYNLDDVVGSYNYTFDSVVNKVLDVHYFINFMYSNYDIYNSDNELVFQGAPSTQVIIQGITQVEEIPQVMEQVLKILIPIGLIVFSIGLVIYLTRLVISRVQ